MSSTSRTACAVTARHSPAGRRRSDLALRGPRAAMLAISSASLGTGAHAFPGGGLPHLSVLLPLTLVVAAAGTLLAERRRSAWGMLGTLGCSQLLMHVFLSATGPHAAGGAASHGSGGLPMAASHALATLLTGLLLVHADTLLVVAWSALHRAMPCWWASPRPALPPEPALPGLFFSPAPLRGFPLLRTCPTRGPPLCC